MASINKEIASVTVEDVFALIPAHARKKSHEGEEGVSLAPLYQRVKSREGEKERRERKSCPARCDQQLTILRRIGIAGKVQLNLR